MRLRTRVRTFIGRSDTDGYRAGVSLHSHTCISRESLEFLPHYALRIPIVKAFVRSELARYEEGSGAKADFTRAYWTNPASPSSVLGSERGQIAKLDLQPFVSITDHDSVEAGLLLTQAHPSDAIPISVEWTMPYGGSNLHLGVHNLPAARASHLMLQLATYTKNPEESALPELLALLDGSPETLVVLNHPLWDHRRVGLDTHRAVALKFLSAYRSSIHALELNGLRPWRENREVLALAEQCGLPAVAGGDRHSTHPNTLINLTGSATWAEFVAEVRAGVNSEVLLMPEYWRSLSARNMGISADALRHFHRNPYGQRRFIDRVYIDLEGNGFHPLTWYWDGGVNLWLRIVVRGLVALGSPGPQAILHWSLSSPDHSRRRAVMTPATDLTWELTTGSMRKTGAIPPKVSQAQTSQL